MSPQFVPKGPVDNKKSLVYIMAWRRLGNKAISEPMMVLREHRNLNLVVHLNIQVTMESIDFINGKG